MKKRIATDAFADSCYFRTTAEAPFRKALVQINEDCNLKCAHCFVSAGEVGEHISLGQFRDSVLPQLKDARVISVSLTGGEPMRHPEVDDIIRCLNDDGMKVTICTNGTLFSEGQMLAYAALGNVSCNVSLDGFSSHSHGKFRGDEESFEVTKSTIEKLGRLGLLKGILVTPNDLAKPEEYDDLCRFAERCGARYVLMNPLASMGRGVRSKTKLEADAKMLAEVARLTIRHRNQLDVVHIRFPSDAKPLTACEAGNIIYVFTTGEVTVCPYLVFAADTPHSKHDRNEFIVGNILRQNDIAQKLDEYDYSRLLGGDNTTCRSCGQNAACGKGCPAGVIAGGGRIGDLDSDVCPVVPAGSRHPARVSLPLHPTK